MHKIGVTFSLLAMTTCGATSALLAQDAPAPNAPAAAANTNIGAPANAAEANAAARVVVVGANNVAGLPGQLGAADAVSIRATRQQIEANPASLAALLGWVRGGGVVFLHNDAAQLFGYRTVRARATTNRQAGQLYGRAVTALPFGAHPLLWGNVPTRTAASSTAARSTADTEAGTAREAPNALGVRLVFYQMRPNDHLVVEHPAGVPLLRVTDLAARNNNPLYAAAIAPFGNGWAVFTPDLVEDTRADGALFLDNLMKLATSAHDARASAGGTATTGGTTAATEMALASLSADVIERDATAARGGNLSEAELVALAREASNALRFAPVGPAEPKAVVDDAEAANDQDTNGQEPNTVAPNGEPADPNAPETPTDNVNVIDAGEAPRLLLLRSELMSLAAWANAARTDETARDNVEATLALLRARLAMQRGNRAEAADWLDVADDAAPEAAEVKLWRGVFAAGQSEDLSLSSQQRAVLLNSAVTSWRDALAARPLLTPTNDNTAKSGISGVPVALIRSWGQAAVGAAQLLSAEPPAVTVLGNPDNPIYLRHFTNDQTLRLALPTAQALAQSGESLGWRLDETEILIFPTEQYFNAYRRLAGLGRNTVINPAQQFADATGSRIYMLSQVSLPIFLPAAPGQPPVPVQLGTSVSPVMSRLHAQAMIAALTQGGNPAPEWMQIGLMALHNLNVTAEVSATDATLAALRRLPQNRLFTPRQYEGVVFQGETTSVAEAQAVAMMMYMYQEFGPGNVVETLQRLGAGQTIDEALEATTDMNEEEFFTAWHDAFWNQG